MGGSGWVGGRLGTDDKLRIAHMFPYLAKGKQRLVDKSSYNIVNISINLCPLSVSNFCLYLPNASNGQLYWNTKQKKKVEKSYD